jgi:hypothetical protein
VDDECEHAASEPLAAWHKDEKSQSDINGGTRESCLLSRVPLRVARLSALQADQASV